MRVIEQHLAAAQMNATMLDSLKGVNTVMARVNEGMNIKDM